jgi:Flp pilus assembly protein TadD
MRVAAIICAAVALATPVRAGDAPIPDRFAYTAPEPMSRAPAPRSLGNWGNDGARQNTLAKVITEADALAKTGAWERATAVVNKALDAFPDEPELLIRAGHFSAKRKAYLVSDSYWARLDELQPTNTWVQACRAVLLLRMGHTNEAEARLRAVLEKAPDEMVARFHLACLLMSRNAPDDARHALGTMNLLQTGQAATWARDDWEDYVAAMRVDGFRTLCSFIGSGGEPPLPTTMNKLAGLDGSGLHDAMHQLAESLWQCWQSMQRKEWAKAISMFKAASEAGFDAPAAYQGLAFAMIQSGRAEQGVDVMKLGMTRFPDSSYAHLKYGLLCLDLQRYEEALAALDRARALAPQDEEILLGYTGALAGLGRMNEAWSVLDTVPQSHRPGIAGWFDRPSPHATALRSDERFAAWISGSGDGD